MVIYFSVCAFASGRKGETINTNNDYPTEKLIKYGADKLSDKELLCVILRSGNKDSNVFEVAERILEFPEIKNYGLSGLLRLEREDFLALKGIGEVKSSQLCAITELSSRIRKSSAKSCFFSFTNPRDVSEYYMDSLRGLSVECVVVVYLNSKLQLIEDETITVGIENSSLVSPREIFKKALKKNASSIMILHNHPSGDPTPSKADRDLTKQIHTSGLLLGIRLNDHIIIGDNRYISFKELGYL